MLIVEIRCDREQHANEKHTNEGHENENQKLMTNLQEAVDTEAHARVHLRLRALDVVQQERSELEHLRHSRANVSIVNMTRLDTWHRGAGHKLELLWTTKQAEVTKGQVAHTC